MVRLPAYTRLPVFMIFPNSFRFFSRRYFMPGGYAEMCFLPLFLLLLSTFLPPFVFILWRKPCTLLLCLFLG